MKNYTTGLLLALGFLLFGAMPVSAQPPLTSYSDNTFLVRFDDTKTQAYIDNVRDSFHCEEVWVSQLTKTRLWHYPDGDYPYEYGPQGSGEWIANVQESRDRAKNRAGGSGGAGLNYGVLGGLPNTNGFGTAPGGVPSAPQNPNPTIGDDQMDCHGEYSTFIEAGVNEVIVGIFDTGASDFYTYDNNMAWHGAVVFDKVNYVTPGLSAQDDNGHGNHVTSTIFHTVNKDFEQSGGVKAEVIYTHYKVFDNDALGNLAEILFAFEQAVVSGMQIANFSWTWFLEPNMAEINPFKESLEIACNDYGVLVVCAAGNNGVNLDMDLVNGNLRTYPACYDIPNILTVATTNCDQGHASFSNLGGQSVDISGPGMETAGKYVDYYMPHLQDIDYLDGTSMTTAIVSGIATSLATHQSSFDAQKIKCAIINGAEQSLPFIGTNVAGGVIDALGALDVLPFCEGSNGGGGPRNSVEIEDGKQSSQIAIYPNPTEGNINIELDASFADELSINIFDGMGRLVQNLERDLNKGQNNLVFDQLNLQNGSYVLVMNYNNKTEKQKLVVIK